MPRVLLILLVLLAVVGVVRARAARKGRSASPAWLPKGWPDALRQVALFAFADLLYESVRGIAENNTALAFANARAIVDIERGLGLFFEQGFQAWAMGQRVLIDFANFMYVNSHFIITTSFLVWLYLRRNTRFYFVRNMFMVAMGLALIAYLILPTAPPRFLPELGFVDTIAYYADVQHDSAGVALFFNPYAAVPSMHVAFSLMLAGPAVLLVRRWAFRALWALYPLMVSVVVIVTANHWWLDVAAGVAVAATAAVVASSVLSRVLPTAWAWQRQAGEASA